MENDKQLSKVISKFREETEKYFKSIDGMSESDIEEFVTSMSNELFEEAGYDVRIMGIAISGSRCRGIETDSSDLDVVFEYEGTEREDDVFNLLHEEPLTIGSVEVDINPIRECESGTLGEYLKRAEDYLEEKSKTSRKSVKAKLQEMKNESKRINVKSDMKDKEKNEIR